MLWNMTKLLIKQKLLSKVFLCLVHNIQTHKKSHNVDWHLKLKISKTTSINLFFPSWAIEVLDLDNGFMNSWKHSIKNFWMVFRFTNLHSLSVKWKRLSWTFFSSRLGNLILDWCLNISADTHTNTHIYIYIYPTHGGWSGTYTSIIISLQPEDFTQHIFWIIPFLNSVGSTHGIVANMLDCNIVVNEFELQLCYYVHF